MSADTELRQRIKAELRSIQPDKLPPDPDWPDEARFREDLNLDSLDLVEMIARLEQATGLFVPDADVPGLVSVAATACYMQARQSGGARESAA
jgi:acyl carrier protein